MTNTTKPLYEIEECLNRYLAARDEIIFCAEQFAKHCCVTTDYDNAKDLLDGLVDNCEQLLEDVELIRDDAERCEP